MQVWTRIPVSLDLSVVVSQTIGPRDIPHRRGSVSGIGPLAPQSRGPAPDSETVPFGIETLTLVFAMRKGTDQPFKIVG